MAANRERTYRARNRKQPTKCSRCGEPKPANELYIRVDGNNAAITANSPVVCKPCYIDIWGSYGA
jgi:formylmethanofuran dehydrogenase subunit E